MVLNWVFLPLTKPVIFRTEPVPASTAQAFINLTFLSHALEVLIDYALNQFINALLVWGFHQRLRSALLKEPWKQLARPEEHKYSSLTCLFAALHYLWLFLRLVEKWNKLQSWSTPRQTWNVLLSSLLNLFDEHLSLGPRQAAFLNLTFLFLSLLIRPACCWRGC